MEDETTSASGQAPGWDADPYRRHELRYWDGDAWTEHVSDRGVTAVDPPDVTSPWAAMSATAAAPAAAALPATSPMPNPGASAPGGTAAAAPTAPTRAGPAGPSWAWQPSPATVPAPTWAPPPAPAQPSLGGYPGIATVPTRRRRARWWVVAAIALVVVIVGGGYVILRPPSRIDAGPAAATPAGFRLVRNDDYRFAIPSAWQAREITSADREQLANGLDHLAPGAGDKLDDAVGNVDGPMVLAIDPATRENVNVVPYHWMRGDPSDPDTLAEIRSGIDQQIPGSTISGLTSAPADVHGYPAATLAYGVTVGPVTVYQVTTVIQTGDHVFQVTVTAPSAARAAGLSGRIVPTFDAA
ncbi:MAG TPA: DUF2510 domain-containing protein [Acidimicrobiia bacterium]